jgi:hypothetical protein
LGFGGRFEFVQNNSVLVRNDVGNISFLIGDHIVEHHHIAMSFVTKSFVVSVRKTIPQRERKMFLHVRETGLG